MKATYCIHMYIHSTHKVYARDRRCTGARGVSSRALIRLKSSLKDLIIFPFARHSPSLHVLALFDDNKLSHALSRWGCMALSHFQGFLEMIACAVFFCYAEIRWIGRKTSQIDTTNHTTEYTDFLSSSAAYVQLTVQFQILLQIALNITNFR